MTGPGANVILVGSMGAGKSAVGRRLAEALGLTFVDTDALVERAAAASIADIFTRWGERRLRAIGGRAAPRRAPAPTVRGGGAVGAGRRGRGEHPPPLGSRWRWGPQERLRPAGARDGP